jgi:hypothetical protein
MRDPRIHGAKRRTKPGEPFDPEDLSRRLNAHLAEQKIRAERRRAARECQTTADGAPYNHVPQVAAESFQTTATSDAIRAIARPASRSHREAPKDDDPSAIPNTALKRTQSRLERHLLSSRSQFQRTRNAEQANQVDGEREIYTSPQRTFASEFANLKGNPPKSAPRQTNTRDVLWEQDLVIVSQKAKAAGNRNDRQDWSQQDDELEGKEKNKKEKTNPLRKRDSNWIFLGIKSMNHEKEIDNVNITPPDSESTGTKIKAGFLARFKRHPS